MNEEVIHTLAKMVAMPTVSHRPLTALAAYLAERSESAGFRVHRFETSPGKSNIVAIAGPDRPGGLVISGHMDVVPVDGQHGRQTHLFFVKHPVVFMVEGPAT